jgi:hypothetical protein
MRSPASPVTPEKPRSIFFAGLMRLRLRIDDVCSIFVLMVAELPSLLSDHPSDVPRRAGLGDRFHHFRGRSGRRYLFSVVAGRDHADFRSVVAIVARRTSDGRLAALSIATLDARGRPADNACRWPPLVPHDGIVLVHLLAVTDAERCALVADLAPVALALAA